MSGALRDVIGAAAGLTAFAVESARDLVQYMVRRGQMTQEEADKLIREAEEAKRKARQDGEDRRRRKSRRRSQGKGTGKGQGRCRAAPRKPPLPQPRSRLRRRNPPPRSSGGVVRAACPERDRRRILWPWLHSLPARPARLDFGGGWTDVPPYSEERGGCVCNVAIELHAVATVRAVAATGRHHRRATLQPGQRARAGRNAARLDAPRPGHGRGGVPARRRPRWLFGRRRRGPRRARRMARRGDHDRAAWPKRAAVSRWKTSESPVADRTTTRRRWAARSVSGSAAASHGPSHPAA